MHDSLQIRHVQQPATHFGEKMVILSLSQGEFERICLERKRSRLQSQDSEKYQYLADDVPNAIHRAPTEPGDSVTCMAGLGGITWG